MSTGFGSQFQYSFTSPAVKASTVRFNVPATTPPTATLGGPPTISGNTALLAFSTASVGLRGKIAPLV